MKQLLLIAAILVVSFFKSQSPEPLKFTDVVQVDSSKNAKYLYANAKMWFSKTFTDPKEVIVLDDTENNILMGRGIMKYDSKILMGSAPRAGYIMYDVIISCKDGKYKYEIANFTHTGQSNNTSFGIITNEDFFATMKGSQGGPKGYKTKIANEIKAMCNEQSNYLEQSLKSAMNNTISTKENW